jgi:hypothetical protein
MNIYKIWRDECIDYDTYDSAIVVAENEKAARLMHPSGIEYTWNGNDWVYLSTHVSGGDWTTPDKVKVELIGYITNSDESKVLLASFNAG